MAAEVAVFDGPMIDTSCQTHNAYHDAMPGSKGWRGESVQRTSSVGRWFAGGIARSSGGLPWVPVACHVLLLENLTLGAGSLPYTNIRTSEINPIFSPSVCPPREPEAIAFCDFRLMFLCFCKI